MMMGGKNTNKKEEERDDVNDESALRRRIIINAMSFNHDASCVVVSTGTGFRIVRVDTGDVVHRFDTIGPMRLCELLRNTRLVACVGDGGGMDTPDLSPRRLKILNVDWQTLIADLAFRTTIRNVKMNRHVLVVCEDEETTVFEMKGLTKVMNVPQRKNVKGVAAINSDAVSACDFSGTKKSNDEEEIKEGETTTTTTNNNNNNNSYLAVVSHLSETTIVIYDLHNVHVATEIRNAHEGPVAMLAFSQKGNILASCSVKGTVVRTWDVPSGEPRNIFRRGSTTAEITSLQFAYSIQNKCTFQPELLTVASDSGTAHVFQCFENTNTISRTSSEKEEGKEEENESNEEKKTKAIETKYASSSSSSSTAQKIVHMGGMVSKLALAGAKIVTKTSVNALAKVSNSVLHTSGISAKFTKSFLEPKRAAAVIKLPAHKRMAATRNEKFAIGLGGSGESNVQKIDVVDNITADKSTIANGQTAAVSAPTSRVEWNVVTIRPEDFVTRTQNVGSSKNKSVALINKPPSLNPDDEDEGDTIDDMKRTTTQRVRVVCASSTGILYDYRVRLKRQQSSSSSSSSSQAVNTNDEVSKDDDDDSENKSPHLEAARSSSNNNKSEYALEREIYMLNAIGTAAGGSSSPSSSKVRFTGFSQWRRTSHQRRDTQREPSKHTADEEEEEEEENALKFSIMQASQLRS